MTQDDLIAVVDQFGLPREEKQAWWKVGNGRRRLYFTKGKEVTRIHLTGLEEFTHPAVTPLSEIEATRRHLGRVRGEIEVSKHPRQTVLDAFTKALGLIQDLHELGPNTNAGIPDVVVVKLTSPELIARLRSARAQIQTTLPPGVELDDGDAARVLLHEALAARETKPRAK